MSLSVHHGVTVSQNRTCASLDLSAWPCSIPLQGELGVQAPVGFWDPLGLSADGDMDTFKRRRAVELKHGRICRLVYIEV